MKRSLLLAAFLGLAMSAVYVMPRFRMTPSAMDTVIPARIGSWQIQTYQPTEKERKTLADDTGFSKAHCVLPRYEEMSFLSGTDTCINDVADLSIVLSGEDPTNSIHRPERCMEAQGHQSIAGVQSQIALPDGHSVATRRLLSVLPVVNEQKQTQVYHCLTYYFFVGHDLITSDHMTRTMVDISDRLKNGEAQHWAYVLVTICYAANEQEQQKGLLPLEKADRKLQDLISHLGETNINWQMIANRPASSGSSSHLSFRE